MTSESTPNAPSSPLRQAAGPAARWMLPALLMVHVLLSGTYAFLLPLWGAVPDEPLHYSHIKYVATYWRMPRITTPFRDLKQYYFIADPAGTAAHGPVYYWTAALIYKATEGLTLRDQQYVLRLYSVFLGGLMLYLAWLSFLLLFAGRPKRAFIASLLLCLMPYRLMLSGVIYLDIMAALTATFAIYLLVRAVYHEAGPWGWFGVGCAQGLALATKQTGLILLPGMLVVIVLVAWRSPRRWRRGLHLLGAFLAGVILLSGWWYLRSVVLYGTPFATEPRTTQLTWMDIIFSPVDVIWQVWFTAHGLWLSLWSQVGWLPAWSTTAVYGILLLLTFITVVGLITGARGGYRGLRDKTLVLAAGFATMIVALCLVALQWVMLFPHNNEETGKHAQTVLVPLITLTAVGWRYFISARQVPRLLLCLAGLMLIFNGLSIYNLQTNLIPRFAPTPPPLANCRVRDLPPPSALGIKPRGKPLGVSESPARSGREWADMTAAQRDTVTKATARGQARGRRAGSEAVLLDCT